MKIYQTSKSVLCVENNPVPFLNGITSNTMTAPNNAFLNIHGRIVAVFDQIVINPDRMLLLIEKDFVEAVRGHIDKFAKLSGAKVNPWPHHVYFDLDGNYPVSEGEYSLAQKQGQLIVTEKNLTATISEEDYTRFRLDHFLPIQGIDFTDDFLLNVSTEEFVSFRKGCYLGQEPISKVYNRSKPTWKLSVVDEDACTDEEKAKMTSRVTDPSSGRIRGFVFLKNNL